MGGGRQSVMHTRRFASRTPALAPLRPLLLEPVLLEKVWGGDRLRALGKPIAPGARIGESWELADLSATSTGGAGGGAIRTPIQPPTFDSGVPSPATLHDAITHWGPALLGDVAPSRSGDFPLLVKYLDAREDLSIQVHPSIAYCKLHPHAHLKTECWYILDAQPKSVIYKGLRPGADRKAFADAVRAGDGPRIIAMMQAVPAIAGECHLLPSGTLHALGAGVLVAEVQTPSDTTFRVYDWGRQGRALHVEEALECIQWEQARDATRLAAGQDRATLVTTGFFDLVEHRLRPGDAFLALDAPTRPVVVMLVKGGPIVVELGEQPLESAQAPMNVTLGETLLVPAALAATTTLRAEHDATILLAIPR